MDFGGGATTATTTITGQTAITPAYLAEAFIMADSTGDHSVADHKAVDILLRCGNIVASTGFDIYATSATSLTGQYSVRWVWTENTAVEGVSVAQLHAVALSF